MSKICGCGMYLQLVPNLSLAFYLQASKAQESLDKLLRETMSLRLDLEQQLNGTQKTKVIAA